MTRIIAIVVVIAAAVIAYMYTSAGDVEVGEGIEATHAEPAGEGATAAETTLPADSAVEEVADIEAGEAGSDVEVGAEGVDPEVVAEEDADLGLAEVELAEEPVAEEAVEEALEEELIEGTEDPATLEAAAEAEILDDTAETLPAEEGFADEEPDEGVGAVSTEEETGGAGIEGIVAEEGDQDGLPGTLEPQDDSVDATQDIADPGETPPGLDTSVDGAPEAIVPEDIAEDEPGTTVLADEPRVAIDPGPALRSETASDVISPEVGSALVATPTEADLDTLLDAENLDLAAVAEAIRTSGLEAAEQTQLIQALETASSRPALLPAVLDRIREALLEE